MDLPAIFAIALALAMDAFAVAVAAGLTVTPITGRHVFRLSFHFGLFQFLMPIAGWSAGMTVAGIIGGFDHWIAMALLAGIGGKMLYESWTGHEDRPRRDPTRGLTLVLFALATSIDALAVGLSAALLNASIWLASVIIGLVAAGMTWIGIIAGSRLGRVGEKFGHWAERAGGAVLILIGLRILLSHLVVGG